MKHTVLGIAVALAAANVSAALVAKNFDADETTFVFLDESTGLIWTNARSFSPAADNHTDTLIAVDGASFEGISDWRLPTYAEFGLLYSTLGSNGVGTMNLGPLTGPFGNAYWTADVRDSNSTYTWSPFGNSRTFSSNGTDHYIWAVSSVPEVPSIALMIVGSLSLVAWSKRKSGRSEGSGA